MKLNARTKIIGEKVVLVPYDESHVPTYHEWMKDPEILDLTGSEPLTIEQEYEMVKTWRESEDKLTFIICEREPIKMIGDTNVYFGTDDDDLKFGEVEIMIAEKEARGKKYGWESMHLMILYVLKNFINLSYLVAKIKTHNHPSIKMFEKMGFQEISKSEIFKEMTLRVEVNSTFTTHVKDNIKVFEIFSQN